MLEEELLKERYCRECGAPVSRKRKSKLGRFNGNTGIQEEVHQLRLKCPNYHWWNEHENSVYEKLHPRGSAIE